MVAFDNSVTPAASKTTRYYGACPERSRENDQRVLLETDATGAEFDLRYFVYGNNIDFLICVNRRNLRFQFFRAVRGFRGKILFFI